jgi:Fe-S oxidoreductase
MCPSFKVTRDRRHSPKGRAGLMREWLRQLSNQGVNFNDLESALSEQKSSLFDVIERIKNTIKLNNGQYDYSQEVMEAMNECLACKACTSACPIKVDVPTFRARFLQAYYSRYQRPIKDYLVGTVEQSAPLMAKAPRLANLFTDNPISSFVIEKVIGYIDTPLLSYPTLKQSIESLKLLDWDVNKISAMPLAERKKIVAIVQDPFTSYYDAEVVRDWINLILKLGYTPLLLPFIPNGKPQHVKGFLKKFAKTASDAATFLQQVQSLDITLVGTDPSLVLCYRDEYINVLGADKVKFNVYLPHEWLTQIELPKLNESNKVYKLFGHCSEKTAIPATHAMWQKIFHQMGAKLEPINVGCCGMAGTYGHEKSHFDNAKGIFDLSWQPAIEKIDNMQMLATGYSCRSQVKRFEKFKPLHPVQALNHLL